MLHIDSTEPLQLSNPKINTNFQNLDVSKQPKITAQGLLKGDGAGSITAAVVADIMAFIRDSVYPVGSIKLSTTNVNPATYFGGTWIAWGQGRVPVGVDTSQTEFNAAEKTGGEKTHTLTTAEMPKHLHNIYNYHTSGGTNVPNTVEQKPAQGWRGGIQTDEQGGDQPHNNLQPYITCYMWKRTT